MASICSEPDGLENYDVGDLIGRGAHSRVHLAVCKRGRLKGRRIVLKILPKSLVIDESAYRDAVDIHRSLHHPVILSLFSTFETLSAFYEVLEYCSRGPLAQYIPKVGSLPESTAQRLDIPQLRGIIRNLVEGLIYIHRNQVLHLDLQLSNIYLTKDNRVRIGGFHYSQMIGIGKPTFPFQRINKTSHSNPQYFIAPEVLGWRPYGPAADIWSLGGICAVIATRKYTGFKTMDTNFAKSLPSQVRDLITGLIQEDPRDRASLHEMLAHPFLDPDLPIGSLETLLVLSNEAPQWNSNNILHEQLERVPESKLSSWNSISPSIALQYAPDSLNLPNHGSKTQAGDNSHKRHCLVNTTLVSIPTKDRSVTAKPVQYRSHSAPSSLPVLFRKDLKGTASLGHLSSLLNCEPPPVLHTGTLQPRTFRTVHGTITLQKPGSIIVDLRKGERSKGRKGDVVLLVSPGGAQVEIYHAPHLTVPCILKDPVSVLSASKLPKDSRRIYTFATQYLDLVKKRTPMIAINMGNAKCSMMSNIPRPDIELLVAQVSLQEEELSGRTDFSTRIRLSRQDRTLEISKYRQDQGSLPAGKRSTTTAPRSGEWTKRLIPLLEGGGIDFSQIQGEEIDSIRLLMNYVRICEVLEIISPISKEEGQSKALLKELRDKFLCHSSPSPPKAVTVGKPRLNPPNPKDNPKETHYDSDGPQSTRGGLPLSFDTRPIGLKPHLTGLGLPPRPRRYSISRQALPVRTRTNTVPRTVRWSPSVDERASNFKRSLQESINQGTPRYFEDVGWLIECNQVKIEWLLLDGERLTIDNRGMVRILSKQEEWKSYGRLEQAMASPVLSQTARAAIHTRGGIDVLND